MTTQTERKTYNVNEVSKVLGISTNLARRQLKEGVIPSVRLGSRWLIPVRLFDEWLNKPKEERKRSID